MNRDYQKFGRENFQHGERLLAAGTPEEQRDAFRTLWEAYENFLDGKPLAGSTMRERNSVFEECLRNQAIFNHFVRRILSPLEAGFLADLEPQVFNEEAFQRTGHKRVDEHRAYASDYQRIRSGRSPKEPLARLLNLLYVVRNNLQHGQKILPQDWPEMRERNLQVFRLAAPLQRAVVQTLFETLWADGLFAYGTRCPSSSRFSMVEDLVDIVQDEYFVSGWLYDCGTHPGLVMGMGDRIHGSLLRSSRLHQVLARTDEIEGAAFKRRLAWARSDSADRELALVWVYEFAGDTAGLPTYRGP